MESKTDCIFCKISNSEIPAHKIWEDENYIAILDIFPNIKGQTLVITKNHFGSYAFDLKDKEYSNFLLAVKNVAKILESSLDTPRVHLVLEGTGVNHLHAKLYPAIGLKRKDEVLIAEQKIHFEKYEGYITTLMGNRASDEELEVLANRIKDSIKRKDLQKLH